jgi:hypothetical protein
LAPINFLDTNGWCTHIVPLCHMGNIISMNNIGYIFLIYNYGITLFKQFHCKKGVNSKIRSLNVSIFILLCIQKSVHVKCGTWGIVFHKVPMCVLFISFIMTHNIKNYADLIELMSKLKSILDTI